MPGAKGHTLLVLPLRQTDATRDGSGEAAPRVYGLLAVGRLGSAKWEDKDHMMLRHLTDAATTAVARHATVAAHTTAADTAPQRHLNTVSRRESSPLCVQCCTSLSPVPTVPYVARVMYQDPGLISCSQAAHALATFALRPPRPSAQPEALATLLALVGHAVMRHVTSRPHMTPPP